MIDVSCTTNIDKYKGEKWPTKMVCLPNKGDMVEAESGKILRVAGITHAMRHERDDWNRRLPKRPVVLIELHGEWVDLRDHG